MKKYMIRSDMEGLTGVVRYEQVVPGAAAYRYGQGMLIAELIAIFEGLKAGGADGVVIYDEHYDGTNIDVSLLPAGIEVICGKPAYRADWAGGLDDTFAGMILQGYHAMAGTPDALLAHTYEPDIARLVLNGQTVGEIGLEAAVAGDAGVALQLVIGDSAGVAEAQALLPGVVGVIVKQSITSDSGVCPTLPHTRRAIYEAARQLAADPPNVQPFCIAGPVKLEVHLNDGSYLDAVGRVAPDVLVDRNVVGLEGATTTQVWADYWQLKFKAQADVAAAKGAA